MVARSPVFLTPYRLMFVGEYSHTFDTKNRISIPAKFRKGLGKTVIITRGLDHCLYVFARKAWEREAARYAAQVNGTAAERGLARLFLSGSFEGDIDTAGRVLIPENLKAYANLGGKALVAGVADRVEIWEERAWRVYTEKIEREADSLAERVNER